MCRNLSLVSSHLSVLTAWPLELVPRVSRLLQPVYPTDALSPPEAGGGGEGGGGGEEGGGGRGEGRGRGRERGGEEGRRSF